MKTGFFFCKMLTVLMLVMFSPLLSAHKLSIFAEENGGEIQGSAYFYGGGKAKGIKITFYDRAGKPCFSTRTSEDGTFAGEAPSAGPIRIEADSGDGHKVEYIVEVSAVKPPGDNASEDTQVKMTDDRKLSAGAREIRKIISEEFSARITPLRHEMENMDDKLFLRDIISGICIVIGLLGAYLYFAAGRKQAK